jgi:membrane-bound lytic murein transglycosylase MltF
MKLPLCICIALAATTFSAIPLRLVAYPPKAFMRASSSLVSPRILWGLAYVESRYDNYAIGPDKHDRGMFQLRDKYDKCRGVVNPFDPVESYKHATKILLLNFKYTHSWDKAIAAYNQGLASVMRDGIKVNRYVKKVKEAIQ